jgi:phage/plasmid-associated DNA primase
MKKVKRSELSNLRMIAGNENKYDLVIDENGNLKEWVGIGWIHIRHATEDDYKDYPELED